MSAQELILIDRELCTRCGHCVEVCPAGAINPEPRTERSIAAERCVKCGRCVQNCSAFDSLFDEPAGRRAQRLLERSLPSTLTEPLFAAYDRTSLPEIRAALLERNLVTVIHCDTAVFAPLAEEFGLPPGSLRMAQVVSALRVLGFNKVYSNTLPAAVSVLEQAKELTDRVQKGGNLPLINASCPAAVQFIEQHYPELIHYFSGCRSPRQLAGSLTKAWLAELFHVDPAYLYNISLASCTAHKFEAARPELRTAGKREIDAVMTTRELAWLMKHEGIAPNLLEDSEFDEQMAVVPEAAGVFCHTGDISQAVLAAAADMLGAREAALEATRGEGTASFYRIRVDGRDYPAAAVSGLQEAVPFLEAARAGKSTLRFLEIMACPQGCVSGGGQPKVLLPKQQAEIYGKRVAACIEQEAGAAHLAQNETVRRLYEEVLLTPPGDKSNRVLYTRYVERSAELAARGSKESDS